MDAVEFHCEPPSTVSTMVVAFGGWIDAGEAVTGAMRHLVRQLAASPLASIDPEDFFDFTQVRPVVRLTATFWVGPNLEFTTTISSRGATRSPPSRW